MTTPDASSATPEVTDEEVEAYVADLEDRAAGEEGLAVLAALRRGDCCVGGCLLRAEAGSAYCGGHVAEGRLS